MYVRNNEYQRSFYKDFVTGLVTDESDELGNPWEKSGEFEGDIILKPDESIRNGLINDEFYWPNKTLIYKIDSETYGECLT